MPSSTSSFKRFARKLAALALLWSSLFLLLNSLVASHVNPGSKRQFQALFAPVPAETVILGSSHATHGIDPRPLGPSCYNFAFNGASPRYNGHLYEDLMRRFYPRPKTVVYQADWFMFVPNPFLFRHIEQDSAYLPFGYLLQLAGQSDVSRWDLLLSRFVIFRERQNVELWFSSRPSEPGMDMSAYDRGYVPYTGHLALPEIPAQPPDPARLAEWERLLDDFRRDGVRVVLVQTPELLAARTVPPGLQELLAQTAERRGLPLLNYNTDRVSELNRRAELYGDWGHLNLAGSQAFSQRLADDLRALSP